MKCLNLSAYKFVNLESKTLPSLREQLIEQALKYNVKGSILLSIEGINIFVAAEISAMNLFAADLKKIPEFSDLWFKQSESDHVPFKRMRVRIKSEIISMRQPNIKPAEKTASYLEPQELKQWYEQNKDMVVLDTRNKYEVDAGAFDQSIHLNIENFSDFPDAVNKLPESWKTKPIVTVCTGGIRCEKATAYMLNQGFKNVWQLKGGIINYFEQCKGDYFQKDCFVFDERVVLHHPAT